MRQEGRKGSGAARPGATGSERLPIGFVRGRDAFWSPSMTRRWQCDGFATGAGLARAMRHGKRTRRPEGRRVRGRALTWCAGATCLADRSTPCVLSEALRRRATETRWRRGRPAAAGPAWVPARPTAGCRWPPVRQPRSRRRRPSRGSAARWRRPPRSSRSRRPGPSPSRCWDRAPRCRARCRPGRLVADGVFVVVVGLDMQARDRRRLGMSVIVITSVLSGTPPDPEHRVGIPLLADGQEGAVGDGGLPARGPRRPIRRNCRSRSRWWSRCRRGRHWRRRPKAARSRQGWRWRQKAASFKFKESSVGVVSSGGDALGAPRALALLPLLSSPCRP